MPTNLKTTKGVIPDYIKESWKRCHLKGLTSAAMDKEHLLGEYELGEYYNRYDELLYYSSSIFKDIYHTIQGTEFLLLIATPEGYIIDTIGEPSFIRHADNVALRKGANWLEEAKGTNAIGTAIVEKKPVLVQGSQHFQKDNHFLTCAAAPIFDPDGRLLGIVNISSYQQNYHPITLGLIKSAAHSIEQSLLLAQTQKQTQKITKDLAFIYDHHPSSLITFNNEGKVTRLNFTAARTIGCSESSVIGQPISSILAGFDPFTITPAQSQSFLFGNQVFTTHTLPSDNNEQSCLLLQGEIQKQTSKLMNRYHFTDIISNDHQMNELISIAKRAAILDISLLISGETGTGKELFAQSIHGASLRKTNPFIAINCGAIAENLLESELFGYEKGAFTGAKTQGQIGKFEAADGGTLFLDEIGDMPLAAQVSLLRVLQEGYITRIGGTTPRPIDVRIIAATNKDLQKEVEAGRFRADLYFRLNGFTLKLPSLRDRTDLLLLADHILSQLPFQKEKIELTEDAKRFITEYEWSGNFRQLKNVLQQTAFLANHNRITKSLLMSLCPPSIKPSGEEQKSINKIVSLQEHEITLIKQVLEQTHGNISRASKQLNIGRNTLYRKLKDYSLII
ncbi:sigma-54-dependent Fis family transcriptional regulator [Neobacillus sp. PS3-40]|uniref:sigma-54-dependent Fis family transcriptional regulator n=1 Tax=Neobacillus sp. PS3-40 TaxID=3070679 RepID=UPI0027DF8887|nr:sigma-54-dependent Fis family transcriptional regulator [Neobacillus sp. PS3-40]WML46329.1 sigma-54-dependent Fis family transcriptional regulator [Neobacillus sp. PS3-40]